MPPKRPPSASAAPSSEPRAPRRSKARVVYADPGSSDEDFEELLAARSNARGKRAAQESEEEDFEETPRQQAAKGKRRKPARELSVVSQDPSVVLRQVFSLRDRMKTDEGVQRTVQELGLSNVREVTEMTNDQVRVQIEDLVSVGDR